MQPNEIGNPESVTTTEARFFDEMKEKIGKLLGDLKTQKYIEKPTKTQIDIFLKIVNMNDRHSKIYNNLTEIFKERDRTEQFLECSSKYGITKDNFPEMYVFIMIANFNRQTEGFKLAFLIMLKKLFSARDKDKMTLGQLCGELDKKSTFSKEVTKELELVLRNVFAHQSYWFENGKIYYCEDASLQNVQTLDIDKLMMKAKRQNIVFQAFLKVFAEKVRVGFFSNIR